MKKATTILLLGCLAISCDTNKKASPLNNTEVQRKETPGEKEINDSLSHVNLIQTENE
jgi:hypothetical protein